MSCHQNGRRVTSAMDGDKAAFGVVLELGIPTGSAYRRLRLAKLGSAVRVADSFRAEVAGMHAGVRALQGLLQQSMQNAINDATAQTNI